MTSLNKETGLGRDFRPPMSAQKLERSHRELIETLNWVRRNYAAGSTAEINDRIDAALAKATAA